MKKYILTAAIILIAGLVIARIIAQPPENRQTEPTPAEPLPTPAPAMAPAPEPKPVDQPVIAATLTDIKHQRDSVGQFQFRFNLTCRNLTARDQEIYIFIWAQNDTIIPPERGIWPMMASINNLTGRRQLQVTDHRTGARFDLAGGASEITTGAIVAWEKAPFIEYRVVVYSGTGQKIFDETKNF